MSIIDDTAIRDYVNNTKQALVDEKEAEAERITNRSLKVTVVDSEVGLKGRTKVRFKTSIEWQQETPTLLAHITRSTGTKVKVVLGDTSAEGVVQEISMKSFVVEMNDFPDGWFHEPHLLMNMQVDEVTHRRYKYGLDDLEKLGSGHIAEDIVSLCFNGRNKSWVPPAPENPPQLAQPFLENLNNVQQQTVAFAMNMKPLSLILGPPGTGKTTTITELIMQLAINSKERLLVCAPSNIAVDNIVEKLSALPKAKQLGMVRIGHPARMLESVIEYSMDSLLTNSENARVVKQIRKDMDTCLRNISRANVYAERKELRYELRALRKDLRIHEKKSMNNLVAKAKVVLTTCAGSGSKLLRNLQFDTVIVDEAAQCMEVATWIPLLKGKRAILAGDPFQLAPTVMSNNTKLAMSLFERMYKRYGDGVTRMLTIQYRMNADIMRWSSKEFYKGKLAAHESVAYHTLEDLDHVEGPEIDYDNIDQYDEDELTNILQDACLFIDTAGAGFMEGDQEGSKFNKDEVPLVANYLKELYSYGIKESDVAVITPYSAQVQLLKNELQEIYPDMEIGTVDGFQGREKEVILFSMVRSNKTGDVGFLADERRTNVAITRARRQICIIGNSTTIRTNPFLQRLIKHVHDNGIVKSAFDLDK